MDFQRSSEGRKRNDLKSALKKDSCFKSESEQKYNLESISRDVIEHENYLKSTLLQALHDTSLG